MVIKIYSHLATLFALAPVRNGCQRVSCDAVFAIILGVQVFGAEFVLHRVGLEEGSAVDDVVDEDDARVAV